MSDEQVLCPGGCGCKVPQSAIDAVLAKRTVTDKPYAEEARELAEWVMEEFGATAEAGWHMRRCGTQ